MLKTISRLGRAAAVAMLLVGCQTLSASRPPVSMIAADVPDGAARAIATDMATQLRGQLSVAQTSIRLKGEGSVFGEALDTALRDLGFAVGDQEGLAQDPLPTDVFYTLDRLEADFLVRLNSGELELTRLYRLEPDGAVPSSPVAVLHRQARANG